MDDKLENVSPTKSSEERDDSLLSIKDPFPYFIQEPKNAYVFKNKPAHLYCKAANSLEIYFKCNGDRSIETHQESIVEPQSGMRVTEAEINVTRDKVEEYFGKDKFKCECYASNGARGTSKSQPATIEVACKLREYIHHCFYRCSSIKNRHSK